MFCFCFCSVLVRAFLCVCMHVCVCACACVHVRVCVCSSDRLLRYRPVEDKLCKCGRCKQAAIFVRSASCPSTAAPSPRDIYQYVLAFFLSCQWALGSGWLGGAFGSRVGRAVKPHAHRQTPPGARPHAGPWQPLQPPCPAATCCVSAPSPRGAYALSSVSPSPRTTIRPFLPAQGFTSPGHLVVLGIWAQSCGCDLVCVFLRCQHVGERPRAGGRGLGQRNVFTGSVGPALSLSPSCSAWLGYGRRSCSLSGRARRATGHTWLVPVGLTSAAARPQLQTVPCARARGACEAPGVPLLS